MLRFCITVLITALFASRAYAGIDYLPSGPNLVHAGVSNHFSAFEGIANPANGIILKQERKRFMHMGLLGSIGIMAETGKLDRFYDDAQDLQDQLDRTDITPSEANTIIEQFNGTLELLAQEGYAKIGIKTHLPAFPLVISPEEWKGNFVLDANVTALGKLRFLYSPLTYNDATQELESNTAAYGKIAQLGELSTTYSFPLIPYRGGNLYAGVRANYYYLKLGKQLLSYTTEKDQDEEPDIPYDTTEALGLDVGINWLSRHHSLGMTVYNLNEPRFAYNAIGQNCQALTGVEQDRCLVEQSYAGNVSLKETHIMERQARLEAAMFTARKNLILSGSFDINPVPDLVGDKIQWGTLTAAIATRHWWMPAVRFGYRTNMAGTKVGYRTFGLTLFNGFNIDIAQSTDKFTIEGDEHPRSLAFNIGFEMAF